MQITKEQYNRIKHLFPKQRGNVAVSNLDALNGLLYVAEHGCGEAYQKPTASGTPSTSG